MTEENATTTYLIPEPFDQTVKLLRKLLPAAGLRITGELNMSGRIQKALLIGTAPCLVLFASPGAPISDRQEADPCGAVLTPLHIVLSARGLQTEVHVLRVRPRDEWPVGRTTVAALGNLQAAISRAIEKIGMRAGLGG